jgi:hypothetical protein
VKFVSKEQGARRVNVRSILAVAGMTGPLVLVIADVTAGLSSPSYSYIDDSISSLALTSRGWVQTIGFLTIGLLVEIFVAGLLFDIRPAWGFHFGIGLLVFFGFGMLLIGAFHTDPAGTLHRSLEGRLHATAATASFWLFPGGMALIAPSLHRDPNWRNIFVYTLAACLLDVALVITMGVLIDVISWFGALERLTVANMVVWVEVAGIKQLRLSLKHKLPFPLVLPSGEPGGRE